MEITAFLELFFLLSGVTFWAIKLQELPKLLKYLSDNFYARKTK